MNLTLITATYNSEKTIEETLKSVLVQKALNETEWIFQDNNSQDNTIPLIQKYKSLLERKGLKVIICSEHDAGIADAWNKGIIKATGKIIGTLNADDTYGEDVIERVLQAFDSDSTDVLYGTCKRVFTDGTIKVIGRNIFPFFSLWSFGFSHTTCFVKKRLYERIGFFDTSYRIAFDYDFLLRAKKNGVKFRKGDYLVYMKDGGISTTQIKKAEEEKDLVLIKNGYSRVVVKTFNNLRNIYRKIK